MSVSLISNKSHYDLYWILIGNDKIMAKKINEMAQETSGPMRTADTDSNEDVLG